MNEELHARIARLETALDELAAAVALGLDLQGWADSRVSQRPELDREIATARQQRAWRQTARERLEARGLGHLNELELLAVTADLIA